MRIALRLLAIGLLWTSGALAQQVERIPMPEGVFYYQPAASVYGSEAAWVNPAGLGRYHATSAQLMADYFDENFAKSWGWLAGGEELALGWRKVEAIPGDFKEWVFAGGIGISNGLSIGGSYRYFSDGPSFYNNRHFWNLALLRQGNGPLSFGAVFSNLNRSKIDGERTEVEMRYSLAYRLFNEKLTVAADAFLSTGTRFRNADWVYHAEYTPIPGLYVNGFVDSDRNFQVGMRVNLSQHFFGTKGGFRKNGDHRGTTAFIGTTELRQPSVTKQPKKRLNVSVTGDMPENPAKPVFGTKQLGYSESLLSVYRAADDPYIKEVLVKLDGSPGFGRAQEFRDALGYVKSRGKRVISHLTSPSNLNYYIASISDSVFIPPVSQLNLVGLRAELTFYAGTLDKLGVKIDMLRIGDYKTAAETWTRTAATDENREQINRILDEYYAQFVADIAVSRRMSVDSVKALIDRGPFLSVEAVESGLVDGMCYRDELDSCIGWSKSLSVAEYIADTLINYSWEPKPVLALVVAEGDITSDGGDVNPLGQAGGVTPSPLKGAFEAVRNDNDIAAIIFRINSPGGSALAGDEIAHAAYLAANRKPMVVSMANTAASGGYYIAMPATRLFANPATMTGSIGIFGGKADFSGLYEKIALGKELYTRGKFAGMLTTIAPFTDEEREKYFDHLQAFYGHFVNLVAQNRELSADSVDHLGRGRVWSGREALRNGLVDELGGLRQAITYTAEKVGAQDYRVEVYPQKRPLFLWPGRSLLGLLGGLLGRSGEAADAVIPRGVPLSGPEIYARLPFDVKVE